MLKEENMAIYYKTAFAGRHREVVRMLLDIGANANARGRGYVLQTASEAGTRRQSTSERRERLRASRRSSCFPVFHHGI
jgi:hypothetical protein